MSRQQITDLVSTEQQPKEKKKLSPRAVFAIRFVFFILFAFVAPIGHILGKYQPFNYTEKLSVGFAGLVIIAILLLGLKFLVEFYLNGVKTKYSLVKQIVSGFTKLILPMCIVAGLVLVLAKYAEQVLSICVVLIPCEMIAIVVNPLPKWAFENNVEGLANITEKVLDMVQAKKEK